MTLHRLQKQLCTLYVTLVSSCVSAATSVSVSQKENVRINGDNYRRADREVTCLAARRLDGSSRLEQSSVTADDPLPFGRSLVPRAARGSRPLWGSAVSTCTQGALLADGGAVTRHASRSPFSPQSARWSAPLPVVAGSPFGCNDEAVKKIQRRSRNTPASVSVVVRLAPAVLHHLFLLF